MAVEKRIFIWLLFQCILLTGISGVADETVEVPNFLQRRVAHMGSPDARISASAGFVKDVSRSSAFFDSRSLDGASIMGGSRANVEFDVTERAVVAEVAAEADFDSARVQPSEGYTHSISRTSASMTVVHEESFGDTKLSQQQLHPSMRENVTKKEDGEDPKAESVVFAAHVRSKTSLLVMELFFGMFGIDRLFLGALWSGLLRLLASFLAAWLGVSRCGCCAGTALFLAWGPWGAADSAVILANALQGKASIDVLGMRSDFEPSSLDAAARLGVFGAVLYLYILCKVLSHRMPDAKIGFGVLETSRAGGVQQEPPEGAGAGDGSEGTGISFAVPGASVEEISSATAMVRHESLSVSAVESPSEDLSCVVCCEAIEEGHSVRVLPCLHRFHVDCVDQWLVRSRTCPVCKLDITC